MPGVQAGTSQTVGPAAAGGAATSTPAATVAAANVAQSFTSLLSHMREGSSSFRRRSRRPRVIVWLPSARNQRQGGRMSPRRRRSGVLDPDASMEEVEAAAFDAQARAFAARARAETL